MAKNDRTIDPGDIAFEHIDTEDPQLLYRVVEERTILGKTHRVTQLFESQAKLDSEVSRIRNAVHRRLILVRKYELAELEAMARACKSAT